MVGVILASHGGFADGIHVRRSTYGRSYSC